ncbi:P-loop NTPase family protein [Niameybacter massiliensis]|uniref:hypothetical protein n=1 Tax=Niameybacter massiliensis TaxID=1658108 RepID=UPI0006B4C088|nr:hypothetical protein [Niameybacter massiliensis]
MEYKHIIIVGSPGSGKSYLSKKIAEAIGYPLIHLDKEYWRPNWVKTPRNEWVEKQHKMVTGDKWIIDGNYDRTLEMRFEAADVIIDLNINHYLCMWSAIKRLGKQRSDLPNDCIEKVDKEFIDFLKFIWKFPQTGRKNIQRLKTKYPDKVYVELTSRKKVNQWIKEIQETGVIKR